MSSHHEWVEEVWAQHNATRPFAQENGKPLLFKSDDPVIYTNPAGLEFNYRITGFYQPEGACAGYAQGKRYLVNSDSPWMPVAEANLRLDVKQQQADIRVKYGPSGPVAA